MLLRRQLVRDGAICQSTSDTEAILHLVARSRHVRIVDRVMDALRVFPSIILALAIVSATGQSLANVVLVIAMLDVPVFARLVRAEVLALRDENKALRAKMGELIQFGEENDAIGDKMHRLSVALLQAPGWSTRLGDLAGAMRDLTPALRQIRFVL